MLYHARLIFRTSQEYELLCRSYFLQGQRQIQIQWFWSYLTKKAFLNDPNRNSQIQFNTLMPRLQVTIVPKEVGQLWDQILDGVLSDVCSPSKEIPSVPLANLITHTYNPRYNIYQGQCHMQHTPNLCGYHATFNTLCFLNFIKRGESHYNILSGSSFWRFKRRVQGFLFGLKKQHKLGEQWPWREKDILYGDFERSYNKLCLERFQDFAIFRQHQQFQLYSFTWQFQYQNLLLSDQKRRQLNKLIEYFKKYESERPLVISFMLAITNHWMCLNAVKVGNQAQYWFFDSFNRHILDLNDQQIDDLVEHLDQERIRYKKQPFSPFFKKNIGVCFKDTQISLRLIVECLEGRTSIDQYIYNQMFNIFADALEKYWDSNHTLLATAIKQYWHNITGFLRKPIQHHLFTPKNLARFSKMIDSIQAIKMHSVDARSLSDMIKKYQIKTCI